MLKTNPPAIVLVGDGEQRAALKALLAGQGVVIAGEVAQAHALACVPALTPTCVVLDCAAPTVNPLQALPWLRAQAACPPIVALGTSAEPQERALLLGLGATVYLAPDELGRLPEVIAALAAADPALSARAA